MNREPRRIPPKLIGAATQKRHVTPDQAALPKKSKDQLKRMNRQNVSLSPSQPHSKWFGR